MPKPIITVVGSFAVGMTLRTTRMPVFGETLIGSDFDMGPGGKGSNQAVGSARLGAESYFVGIIGDDKLGEIATDLYAAEGVNTQYLMKTHEMATGVGFIILNPAGHNGIILDMSANKMMDPTIVAGAEDQIARSRVVMSVLEIPVPAAGEAMRLGRNHKALTLLNPAPAAPLPGDVIANVDVLTPNETELRVLMGLAPDDPTPTETLAHRLQERGTKTIIVTRGEDGVLILTNGEKIAVPAVKVNVVDTTGAGDAFNSGLAVALAEGKDILTAAKFGACAGALACTKLGVIPALAFRSEVESLYNQNFK